MMKPKAELYSGTYQHYADDLYQDIRNETYGEDIGQTSWVTADEYRHFFSMLHLSPGKKVLEVATGSGGPALFLVQQTGCRLTGIDINEDGVHNANRLAQEHGLNDKMQFLQADASERLPFEDGSFDVVLCIDSMNHLKNRAGVLKEFHRVLKKGGQLLYTDPVVVTGIVTNEEIATRSSIGYFLFAPPGANEHLLAEAQFTDILVQDVTANIAAVSAKWYEARHKRKKALLPVEGKTNFEALQSFFRVAHTLSSQHRLSRYLFRAVKNQAFRIAIALRQQE